MNKVRNKLYIRVPKTASTSMLESGLFTYTTDPSVARDYFAFKQCKKFPERYEQARKKDKIMYLRTRFFVDVAERFLPSFDLDNIFSFGFVRNPFDRAVSSWKFGGNNKSWNTSFLEFCRQIKSADLLPKKGAAENELLLHACEQHPFLICEEKKIKVDFIGRFENLQKDFNKFCNKTGTPQQELLHKNDSKHKHYTEYYDDESRDIIAEKYAKDIKYFGYKFGE